MKEVNKNGIDVKIKRMVGKVFYHIKNKRDKRSMMGNSLHPQTPSMVVVIDSILDEHRKRKIPPFSYDWIRYN